MRTLKNQSIYILSVLLFFCWNFCMAQSESDKKTGSCYTRYDKPLKQTVYLLLDSVASYNGGTRQMFKFINFNLRNPCKSDCIGTTLFFRCVVDTNGKFIEITLLKGFSEEMNTEALRVVNLMPPWKPARCNGHKVCSETIIPVKFKAL